MGEKKEELDKKAKTRDARNTKDNKYKIRRERNSVHKRKVRTGKKLTRWDAKCRTTTSGNKETWCGEGTRHIKIKGWSTKTNDKRRCLKKGRGRGTELQR